MVRTILQKCPCGYEYSARIERRKQVNFDKGRKICFRTGVVSEKHENVVDKDNDVIIRKTLKGDESFKKISFTREPYDNEKFIVCPKCGTVLMSSKATEITEE